MKYTVVDGDILITDASGHVVWKGKPDGVRACQVLAVPGSDDAIVLLDYMAKPENFANLLRLRADGSVRWRAAAPERTAPDSFVDMSALPGLVMAHSWSGYLVTLDIATGEIGGEAFTK